jgi:hypothetical protein
MVILNLIDCDEIDGMIIKTYQSKDETIILKYNLQDYSCSIDNNKYYLDLGWLIATRECDKKVLKMAFNKHYEV